MDTKFLVANSSTTDSFSVISGIANELFTNRVIPLSLKADCSNGTPFTETSTMETLQLAFWTTVMLQTR